MCVLIFKTNSVIVNEYISVRRYVDTYVYNTHLCVIYANEKLVKPHVMRT